MPDDPRGALRWSLSKIRGLVDEPGISRIVANGETVRFDAKGAHIDVLELRQELTADLHGRATEQLASIAAGLSGEFLEGYDLPESHDFHAWCIAEREEARAMRIRILTTLIERFRAQPEAALPHARALASLQPHDEAAWTTLVRLLAATGRWREAEDQCDLGRRVLEERRRGAAEPLLRAWRNLRKSPPINAAAEPSAQAEAIGAVASPAVGRPTWPSVAVVPLRAVSGGSVTAHLADAITEDLVTSLSRDRSLVVVAHGVVLGAERLPLDVRQFAQQIGAHYLVEGSVRHAVGTLVITVRLVCAFDGRHIWGERCVANHDANLAIDDLFARKIAAAIRAEVESFEATKAEGVAANQLDAPASYHIGLREMYRFNRAGLASAQAHFERAVLLDPNFAATHARLSYVHIQHYWYGARAARGIALSDAFAAAKRAIALDPKDALGHFALGRVHALRRQFELAMPELETAIRLNPSLAQAYFGLGQATWYAGQPKEALRLLDTAIELSPHDPHLWSFFHDQSEAYFALGRHALAERSAKAAAGHFNATHWPWVTLAAVLGTANKQDQAGEALRELLRRRPQYCLSVAKAEFSHFSDEAFAERYLEGLQKAGLNP